ncbi:MAG: PEGA domain-containing protein [Deltaproteobacteria bacterium]|nr:PEGA domain-containing protein [Deltaproteobacteria bacterium]
METVALLPINAPDPGMGQGATAQVAQGLRDLQVFRVMDPETMAGLLGAEAMKQGLGCNDQSCLAELAGAVGAAYFVSGTISRSGEEYTINLVLTDQRTAAAVDGVIRQEKKASDVGPAMRVAAQRVVQKLLANRQGILRLVMSEKGADVKLDDVLVGTTPFGIKQLPMGPHKVSVEKEGFIAYRQDVFVKPNETSVITGTLVPNQDFINGYRRKNIVLIAGGALGSAIAVGSVVGAVGAYIAWVATYMSMLQNPPNGPVALAQHFLKFPPTTSASEFKPGSRDSGTVVLVDVLAVLPVPFLLALGPAALAALVCFFFAENPGRYNQFSE